MSSSSITSKQSNVVHYPRAPTTRSSETQLGPTLKYKSDFNKVTLNYGVSSHGRMDNVSFPTTNFNEPVDKNGSHLIRGSVEGSSQSASNWNIWWASVQQVRAWFSVDVEKGSSEQLRLKDDQIINHFPNHFELTRKDLMYKNIKRYIRERSSLGSTGNNSAVLCNPKTGLRLVDAVPVTYSLPNDYALFLEEHKRSPGGTWIIKPTNKSQGKGIFLVTKPSQLSHWLQERASEGDGGPFGGGGPSPFIVSRYVPYPLLIGGKKFDLRLYVLVLSYKPLAAYWHEKGFARFCSTKYTEPSTLSMDALVDGGDGGDLGAHLTNVALQKGEGDYNSAHGGKWSLENLWLYVASATSSARAEAMLSDIQFVITHSLLAVQTQMFNDHHCFELYGYDVLIDDSLRPHLIEVNASPSLSDTTASDRLLKEEVLHDTFRLVAPNPPPKNPFYGSELGAVISRSGKYSAGLDIGTGLQNEGSLGDCANMSLLQQQALCSQPFITYGEYRKRTDLQEPHKGGFHLLPSTYVKR